MTEGKALFLPTLNASVSPALWCPGCFPVYQGQTRDGRNGAVVEPRFPSHQLGKSRGSRSSPLTRGCTCERAEVRDLIGGPHRPARWWVPGVAEMQREPMGKEKQDCWNELEASPKGDAVTLGSLHAVGTGVGTTLRFRLWQKGGNSELKVPNLLRAEGGGRWLVY